MIEIKPTGLYSRADLSELLGPLGIDSDAWVGRLRPKKRFRFAWFGKDLLEAIEKAPALRERDEAGGATEQANAMPKAKNRGNRRGSILKAQRPGSAIDAYLAELKAGKA